MERRYPLLRRSVDRHPTSVKKLAVTAINTLLVAVTIGRMIDLALSQRKVLPHRPSRKL